MIKKCTILLALAFAMFSILPSCKFSRILKSGDNEKKYNAAMKYYEKKDYYHALQLFEELISVYKGSNKSEKMYFYFAQCYYKTGEFPTAAYHFNNFTVTFPNSEFAEEAQFMNAYCYYEDSPTYSLDQTNTMDAIRQFQLFVNKYPHSPRVQECNNYMDMLRFKLENKAFQIAKLYYRTGNYSAAVVALANVVKDFPTTQFKEECLYLSVKSAYLYAKNSIESKKTERFKNAIENYYKLVDFFPASAWIKDAEFYYNQSQHEIKKLSEKELSGIKS
jgi:outer membrane protein assembly factor BamD